MGKSHTPNMLLLDDGTVFIISEFLDSTSLAQLSAAGNRRIRRLCFQDGRLQRETNAWDKMLDHDERMREGFDRIHHRINSLYKNLRVNIEQTLLTDPLFEKTTGGATLARRQRYLLQKGDASGEADKFKVLTELMKAYFNLGTYAD